MAQLDFHTASVRKHTSGSQRCSGQCFFHTRGRRQRDPISPASLLFDLTIEMLTALLTYTSEAHLFAPVGGCSALQRLSMYADDVVPFVRPDIQELVAVREILQLFSEASDLKVN